MMRHTSAIVRPRPTRDYHPAPSHGAPTLSGHVLTFWIARPPLSHGPTRASFPLREAQARKFLSATGCDVHAGTRRVPPVASTSSPDINQNPCRGWAAASPVVSASRAAPSASTAATSAIKAQIPLLLRSCLVVHPELLSLLDGSNSSRKTDATLYTI